MKWCSVLNDFCLELVYFRKWLQYNIVWYLWSDIRNIHFVSNSNADLLFWTIQGLYSQSGKTSYRQISWSLKAARLDVMIMVSLWNLASRQHCCRIGCQISERLQKSKPESRDLRDFTGFCGKPFYRFVKRGHVLWKIYDIRYWLDFVF